MGRGRLVWWLGTGLVALGLFIFLAAAAYVLFAAVTEAQLDGYNQEAVTEARLDRDNQEGEAATAPAEVLPSQPEVVAPEVDRSSGPAEPEGRGELATPVDPIDILIRSPRDDDWRRLRRFLRLPSAPPVRLVMPKIEVDSKIVEVGTKIEDGVWVWETASHAVGYHKGTGLPGRPGNVVLSGHISSPLKGEGSVFKRLPEVRVGDRFRISTADGSAYDYQVTRIRVVPPTEVSVMDPTPDETATLVTCVPDYVYSHRLIVSGKRV